MPLDPCDFISLAMLASSVYYKKPILFIEYTYVVT